MPGPLTFQLETLLVQIGQANQREPYKLARDYHGPHRVIH